MKFFQFFCIDIKNINASKLRSYC